ncbi:MAG: hypothetical protein Harvfovirus31_19 [Harvfovirus sp.]|uniref:Post-SET domain-containing protein n=1 Tax=Harvfovirus sp. TaxID=2487768 RepID=A0A3G5A6E7_9VIRU|nr:MAG: hypothetical protein Harvfovirus31_19 [Harvfovirus sp.]
MTDNIKKISRSSEKIECECGKKICRGNLSVHRKGAIHKHNMEIIYKGKPDPVQRMVEAIEIIDKADVTDERKKELRTKILEKFMINSKI